MDLCRRSVCAEESPRGRAIRCPDCPWRTLAGAVAERLGGRAPCYEKASSWPVPGITRQFRTVFRRTIRTACRLTLNHDGSVHITGCSGRDLLVPATSKLSYGIDLVGDGEIEHVQMFWLSNELPFTIRALFHRFTSNWWARRELARLVRRAKPLEGA